MNTQRPLLLELLSKTHPALLDASLLLLRLSAGIILFVIGSGKVMGWFGGMGLTATIQMFVLKMGIPTPLAYLSCLTEFIGGFLLIIGFLTRPAALAVAINMTVATITILPKGFFFGGAGYPFCLLVMAVVILLSGPRAYSADAFLFGIDAH